MDNPYHGRIGWWNATLSALQKPGEGVQKMQAQSHKFVRANPALGCLLSLPNSFCIHFLTKVCKKGPNVFLLCADCSAHCKIICPSICRIPGQLGRSAIDRALASHHEDRDSNLVGANKCHAQVCWTICPEPNYAMRIVLPLVAPRRSGQGTKKNNSHTRLGSIWWWIA